LLICLLCFIGCGGAVTGIKSHEPYAASSIEAKALQAHILA